LYPFSIVTKGEGMRKTRKHAVYTLKEKEDILELYMSGQKTAKQLALEYDLDRHTRLYIWRDMKLKYGKIVDRRGQTKEGHKPKGRPKSSKKYEEMNREELIAQLRIHDDIKKTIAYLRAQKRNTK